MLCVGTINREYWRVGGTKGSVEVKFVDICRNVEWEKCSLPDRYTDVKALKAEGKTD